ncbi:MAG: glycosyltransferase family 2 protein [Hespellia sp.]|nr:glycosyltransferase family 2 protein [Hespellia sp.]
MKKGQLVSVVIPVYNRADCIGKCLESVFAQSYSNIEVIVVDDGSSDHLAERMKSVKDSRLKFLSYHLNKGACYARNYGAQHASGQYIAFQDSDDTWRPQKLEKQLKFLEACDADMVFCAMNRIPDRGKSFKFPVHAFDNRKDALSQILYENRVSTQTMFMKRETWEAVKFDETVRRYQDWNFAIRAAHVCKMRYQDEILVDSKVGNDSISSVEKSMSALDKLFEKNRKDYQEHPVCLARMYRRMGRRVRKSDKKQAKEYFYQSYLTERNLRNWLGYRGFYFLEE